MNAGHELLLHAVMAFAAGCGHVELEDGRLGIRRGKNFVRTVAVGANCSSVLSGSHRVPVHTVLVSNERLSAQAAGLHDELLPVASTAGLRDVGVIDLRIGIAGGQQLVWTAVAIN